MPATKKGIFHNLKESEYVASNSEVTFFFSSEVYLNKFLERYESHREKMNKRLATLLTEKHTLNINTYADVNLYQLIETRGFRACIKGVDCSWQDLNQYVLRKMTEKNTLNWQRTQKPKLAERLKTMGYI